MDWTNLTLTVRTPMFLGLDDTRNRELRPDTDVAFPVPSLRGALRYWLRALLGAEVGDDLRRLAAAETAVFGAATDRNRPPSIGGPGPSRVAIHALPPPIRYTPANESPPWLHPPGGRSRDSTPNPAGYLLGQGVYDAVHDTLRRPFLAPGTSIRLRARVRADPGGTATSLFWSSLWALRTFGGLGSRARRGLGTLSVSLPPDADLGGAFQRQWLDRNTLDDLADVVACVRACLQALEKADDSAAASRREAPNPPETRPTESPAATPTYPAFVPGAFETMDEPLGTSPAASLADALPATGTKLRGFRTDPDDPTATTREWENILRPWLDGDHSGLTQPFEIGALGLPVVFAQKRTDEGGKNATRTLTVTPRRAGTELRRASPLWLRVYPDDAGRWRLRSLALLAEWLPHDTQLVARTRGQREEPLRKPSQDEVNTLLRYWFE